MEEQRSQKPKLTDGLRANVATYGAGLGAAVLAIAMALIAMTGVIVLLDVLGIGPAQATLISAVQNAAVALYLVQLVGVSFFNHTAELRFAAVPGLVLLGLAFVTATAVMVKRTPGSPRRKARVAVIAPIYYALIAGFTALFAPLHFTASGFGADIRVSPSPVWAFLLSLLWGALFASIGGLIGIYGRDWRRVASRLLGDWLIPVNISLRVLAASLVVSTSVALIGSLTIAGGFGIVTEGGFGHSLGVVAATIVAVPTLAAAVLVSGFGVPFSWRADALSHGHGSISAFGGALPYSGASSSQVHGAPLVLAVAPLVVLVAVFAVGWLSAQRSNSNARLGFANAARAAMLTTLAVWLLALLTRVDAQAGGLLGIHLAPSGGALLWRVPLVAFAGCFVGSTAYLLTGGPASRRQLASLVTSIRTPRSGWISSVSSWPDVVMARGLRWRAALGLGFVSLPLMLIGTGATSTATSAGPPNVSLAPIAQAAEQRLEHASTNDESVAVTVDPETRALGTARMHTPLHALGIAPSQSPSTKAKDVLDHYGDLFGLSNPAGELADAQVSTNDLGGSQVSLSQVADGLPVFGGGIGVHLSQKGELLTFVTGSAIPEVSVAQDTAKLSSTQAIDVAKKALSSGRPAQPARLQVYAGRPPYISGPNARLAWFVWLIGEEGHTSVEYVVDAVTGEILDTIPKTDAALDRLVYNAHEKSKLPGELVREEGKSETKDSDTDTAYNYSETVYKFYNGLTESDSYDKNGAPLESTVHFAEAAGVPYENAYWNGKEVVFGNSFPLALDIVGHEWTHAYTEHTSGLVESGQSGALNESLSDIMGATIEMYETEEENWEIGENLPGKLGPIRNLAKPSLLGDPESLSEWVKICLDNLGVHTNSTITSHAFYLAATTPETGVSVEEFAIVFFQGFTEFLKGNPTATLEDARAATLMAAEERLGKGSAGYKAIEAAFNKVGLNGTAQPTEVICKPFFECSFAQALKTQQGVSAESATAMLTTLYKARGELAFPSAAGKHFLPLYEAHMGRISELVSEDPKLAESGVLGLEEVTPALEALMTGTGDQYRLSKGEMAKIKAALRRLAQDDRLYSGENAGELATLIEEELTWLNLPSYSGDTYDQGWTRLNQEVEAHTLLEEGGPIIDPNCMGVQNNGYPNNFQIYNLYVDTPDHRIPGQVSPLKTGGVICGAEVEPTEGRSGCIGKGSLNTKVTAQLPPGDKVNSSKNLPSGSWVGEIVGRGIACAGNETQILFGQVGLLSLSSWTSTQCPTTAVACYEGRSTFKNSKGSATGKGYAWVSEEGGSLTFTTRPVEVTVEIPEEESYKVLMSFGQFETTLCGRAGSAGKCGGAGATWIHQNGEASEGGCPGGKGLYTVKATNFAGETTLPAYACVRWEEGAHMQTVGAPNSLKAVTCVPETTTCVAADSKGNAFYATNVSASKAATWKSWTGPGVSPSEAAECPSTTLCLLAAGEVSGGGGNLYHATELGGSFLTSFKPTNGVGAASCPSTSFCVTALEGGGFIRYSTKPSGISWTAVSIGSGAMKDVSCLSASFCSVVDGTGNVHVAVTEKGVKEVAGWTATNVDGAAPLDAIACSSTSSCTAVDGSDEVLNLTIEAGGKAKVKKQALAGAGGLTELTCTGSSCVAVDDEGAIFVSKDSGATWAKRFATGGEPTSVSCASGKLCTSVDTSGDVAMFDPE